MSHRSSAPAPPHSGSPGQLDQPDQIHSNESAKPAITLGRLRLNRLPGAKTRLAPMEALSVLHLGCGDGSLCLEAITQGAKRVVGVERDSENVKLARERAPGAAIFQGTWRDFPEETFDVIFLLSLMHYDKDPKSLFSQIKNRLNPNGVLVLECGYVGDRMTRRWQPIRRREGCHRYPTVRLLLEDLLSDFAVRRMEPRSKTPGDSVLRSVFHCTPRRPTAMIITAPSGHGKSNFVSHFSRVNIPGISTDQLLSRLYKDKDYSWRPISEVIRNIVGVEHPNWGAVGRVIADDPELTSELCDTIISEIPIEAAIFTIEGEVLRHETVLAQLRTELTKRAVRPWIAQPL